MRWFIVGATALAIGLSGAVLKARQQAPAPRQQLAEEVFKNIQVLKGMPVDEFMGTMGFLASATGLNCTDCHVDESGGSWARYADDNALKQQTRRMLVMVNTINKTNFGGRQVVTCNTCHRGSRKPNVMPSIDRLYGEPPPDEPGDPITLVPGKLSVDQVLDKYIAALGGAQRLAALTSFTAKGTHLGFDDAAPSQIDIFARATGERATIVHAPSGESSTALNGQAAWIAAPPADKPVPLMVITGQELAGVKLDAAIFFPGRIKQLLTNWRVGIPLILDDRDAIQLQGDIPGGGVATLCFDEETGLLVRMVRYTDSPVGRLVTRTDYHEYREVAGVKVPFRWTQRWLSGRSQFELTELQPNTPISSERFAQPVIRDRP
ncbi:MAG: photosynthetic reaction center cytochrome c subunit [Acidobacteria bacterium]|nr:photosynthetic reaction center cytochrome c subunit [Acidobacteriota bacterium]